MHIGETAENGDTIIYGVDTLPRGVAHSRDVARMWASAPDLVMALQTIAEIAEGKRPGRGKISIGTLARAAVRLAQEEGAEASGCAARPIPPKDLLDACRLAIEGTERDRILFARLMMQKYPHIEGLKELNGRHMKVTDILR